MERFTRCHVALLSSTFMVHGAEEAEQGPLARLRRAVRPVDQHAPWRMLGLEVHAAIGGPMKLVAAD
jgi:hypothetical protein